MACCSAPLHPRHTSCCSHPPASARIHPSFLQVAQLETQLAAAERCAAELHELTTQLGSVRQEDVEVLKVGSMLRAGSNNVAQQGRLAALLRA